MSELTGVRVRQTVGSPATAKNVLSVGSGLVKGLMGGIGTITADLDSDFFTDWHYFDVAQLDGPPASKLVDDNPCQSDVMVPLTPLSDSCRWANDDVCDSWPDCWEGTDASDCEGAAPAECVLNEPYVDMSGLIVIATWSPSSPCSVQEIVTRAEQGGAQCLLFAGDTLVSLEGVAINVPSGQISPRDFSEYAAVFAGHEGSVESVTVSATSLGWHLATSLGLQDTEQLSTFSSKGPTPDGRFKPEVCAPPILTAPCCACVSLPDSLPKPCAPNPKLKPCVRLRHCHPGRGRRRNLQRRQ